ncbi:MAG: hypothetical protein IJV37_03060 [Bacteroidales bacterium]|nr:hypothetical protein [Bacteroidales bacterium]
MTPTQKNNYSQIRTMADLDKAINQVRSRRLKSERSIKKDATTLWRHNQPSHLISGFFYKYSPYLSWTGIGLALVRGAKRLISGDPQPKAIQ